MIAARSLFHTCAAFLCLIAPALGQRHRPTVLTPEDVPFAQTIDDVESPHPPDSPPGRIRLDVVVQDESGSPVGGLTKQDFTVLDNGQSAKILSFRAFGTAAAPTPPVEIILMVDELNMSEMQLTAEEHEAENFLRQKHGQLRQPVSVYWIDNDGLSSSGPPSYDGNLLADEIGQRREPNRIWKTPAVAENLGKFAKAGKVDKKPLNSLIALGSIAIEQRRRPGRKLMFWLGHGWQFETLGVSGGGTGAFDFLTDLSTRLREARITLWGVNEWPLLDSNGSAMSVSTPMFKQYLDDVTPEKVTLGYLQLHVIATQTGGDLLATKSDLAGLIAKQVGQANCFYSLTFDAPRTNVVDEYHRLRVEIGKANVLAQTRAGYFDQPAFYDQPRDDVERVTVAQLEQSLRAAHKRPGSDQARLLSKMELTERLSSTELTKLESTLKGQKPRQALAVLADQSAFLAPPAQDIPSTPAPDPAAQHQIISRAVAYVNNTIPKLPDFFADRTITQHEENPPKSGQIWKTAMGDQSLYPTEVSNATVLFRNGKEIVQGETTKSNAPGSMLPSIVTSMPPTATKSILNTVGTFGAVLNTVLVGAMSSGSDLQWSRWEIGPNGQEAVFRYRAAYESPVFVIGFTYLSADRAVSIKSEVRFQGEFNVDPKTGAILRLTIQADLAPEVPLVRSDVMVEYSPVVIGGQTYICPARSVSIQRQRRIVNIREWGEEFKVYAPFETLLNDMTYRKYHKFHSTARILPEYKPAGRH